MFIQHIYTLKITWFDQKINIPTSKLKTIEHVKVYFFTLNFSQNRLTKDIIHYFFKVQYTSSYHLVREVKNCKRSKVVQNTFFFKYSSKSNALRYLKLVLNMKKYIQK